MGRARRSDRKPRLPAAHPPIAAGAFVVHDGVRSRFDAGPAAPPAARVPRRGKHKTCGLRQREEQLQGRGRDADDRRSSQLRAGRAPVPVPHMGSIPIASIPWRSRSGRIRWLPIGPPRKALSRYDAMHASLPSGAAPVVPAPSMDRTGAAQHHDALLHPDSHLERFRHFVVASWIGIVRFGAATETSRAVPQLVRPPSCRCENGSLPHMTPCHPPHDMQARNGRHDHDRGIADDGKPSAGRWMAIGLQFAWHSFQIDLAPSWWRHTQEHAHVDPRRL